MFDRLLCRGRAPVSDTVSVPKFHAFFDDKVDALRGATADVSPPPFQPAAFDCQLSSLGTVTVTEVTTESLGCQTAYLTSNGLMPLLQPAFRANHSTETAV
jgi:hypothetical protein